MLNIMLKNKDCCQNICYSYTILQWTIHYMQQTIFIKTDLLECVNEWYQVYHYQELIITSPNIINSCHHALSHDDCSIRIYRSFTKIFHKCLILLWILILQYPIMLTLCLMLSMTYYAGIIGGSLVSRSQTAFHASSFIFICWYKFFIKTKEEAWKALLLCETTWSLWWNRKQSMYGSNQCTEAINARWLSCYIDSTIVTSSVYLRK